MKRCRRTNELVEDDECNGKCAECDLNIPVQRIKRKERCDDGRDETIR